jgi:hypothetical protein
MNAYDGCFEEATYYDMDEFDEFLYAQLHAYGNCSNDLLWGI